MQDGPCDCGIQLTHTFHENQMIQSYKDNCVKFKIKREREKKNPQPHATPCETGKNELNFSKIDESKVPPTIVS